MTYSVTVMLIDQSYGGPEEGGWWFMTGYPQASSLNRRFKTKEKALGWLRTVRKQLDKLNEGKPSISDTNSEGVLAASIESGKVRGYPEFRPRYE